MATSTKTSRKESSATPKTAPGTKPSATSAEATPSVSAKPGTKPTTEPVAPTLISTSQPGPLSPSTVTPPTSPGDCGIYQIQHLASGKKYIGSARRIKRRLSKHKTDLRAGNHHCSKLQRSWDKYGEAAFATSVIELVPDEAQLLVREQHWIDSEQALTEGFNICPTAGSCLGRKLTPEHKAKLAAAQLGKKRPPEHFVKVTGVPRSGETRQKISEAKRGKPISAEALAERKTRTSSAETRAKQSAALKGKHHSFESRSKAWITRRANQAAQQ